MWQDPIVEEVRKVREEHAARFGFDLERIAASLREEERASGKIVVPLQPRRPIPFPATSSEEESAPAKS